MVTYCFVYFKLCLILLDGVSVLRHGRFVHFSYVLVLDHLDGRMRTERLLVSSELFFQR